MNPDAWGALAPQFEWRPSQRHLLGLAGHVRDQRWHLCAPPGAGKTLIGVELARHVGRPTLVLAPTTAIRNQWRDSTALFGAHPDRFTSSDPAVPAPLLAVTYQLLGNPGEAAQEMRSAARRLWVAELAAERGAEVAERRVRALESADPRQARRELARRARRLRRSLGSGQDVGVPHAALLGARPLELVEQLVQAGIGCVVLDECHHLLDWWALVVSHLVERLAEPNGGELAVIGLTATLPEPDSGREAENYRGLLGEVDAELHLAAMVAEGGVAPWRDGLRIVQLTPPEQAFLDDWTARFARDMDEHLTAEPFVAWAVAQVTQAALDGRAARPVTGDAPAWDRFWDRDPLAAAALARWWAARGLALPAGFDPPPEAGGQLGLEDRLLLLDAWLHDPDPVPPPVAGGDRATPRSDPGAASSSAGPSGAAASTARTADVHDRGALPSTMAGTRTAAGEGERRGEVERLLARHGVSFTSAGPRWGRSVADLVCARSSAKGIAAAEVLAEEVGRRGDRLRALVAVERDTASTPPAAAREVLGEDAGTTARVLAALCRHPKVLEQGVMAVTGRGAWADALAAERICAAVNVAGDGETRGRWVRTEGCDIPGVVRLVGEGGSWSAARWLDAAEVALGAGVARVLVATRGLVGEGWDHPPLNVLVDLSEVASGTATTQLRGRAIRVDPSDPDKLASLWDVVVAHPGAPGDWHRMRRRHAHWWGPDRDGAVVTGPAKLDPRAELPEPPSAQEAQQMNQASAAALADVVAVRAAWAAVDPAGISAAAVHVRSRRRRRRVRARVRPARWRWLVGGAAGAGGVTATLGLVAGPLAVRLPLLVLAAASSVGAVSTARGRSRDERATLQALGEAVLAGLVAAGVGELADGHVDVARDLAAGWVTVIHGADDDAAGRWAGALAEALGPLGTPRWMVAVGTEQAWRVPATVGATRTAAEAFHRAFRTRLPGARLVRAGTPDATALVLTAARQRPDEVTRSLRWQASG